MKEKRFLHIVAFNVPYPPNYGGVIDIFYKLKAFQKAGVHVILHCFLYNRNPSQALENLCHKIFYYKRHKGLKFIFNQLPYIVITRKNDELLKNLVSDQNPVLFEGLHTSLYLENCKAASKKVFVRTHNIEHNYYKMLARSERRFFKKLYFSFEARKLLRFESTLSMADQLFSISKTDTAYFNKQYGNSRFVSAFHQHEDITSKRGKGDYILFHGNLSVPENEKALIYLVKNVFSKISFRVIIAGRNPSNRTFRICKKYSNIELIAEPDDEKMKTLVNDAHINLLYTYQPTGLKLKLLHSLHGGRFCMTNPLMLSGSGLDDLCEIYRTNQDAIAMIDKIMGTEYEDTITIKRKESLDNYKNETNINRIIDSIF